MAKGMTSPLLMLTKVQRMDRVLQVMMSQTSATSMRSSEPWMLTVGEQKVKVPRRR